MALKYEECASIVRPAKEIHGVLGSRQVQDPGEAGGMVRHNLSDGHTLRNQLPRLVELQSASVGNGRDSRAGQTTARSGAHSDGPVTDRWSRARGDLLGL